MDNLSQLFERYYNKTATPAERQRLMELLEGTGNEEELNLAIQQAWDRLQEEGDFFAAEKSNAILQKILHHQPKPVRVVPVKRMWTRMAAAAAVLVLVVLGFLLLDNNNGTIAPVVSNQTPADIKAPQVQKATITLANGKKVFLESAADGNLSVQSGVQLVKLTDGQVQYKDQNTGEGELPVVYNTLDNPRGSKVISIILADGTRVWLNAGSSLTYPVAFTGKDRKVSITGEAYFEVAHDASRPFKAGKGEMEVTVLGTHFNINAYDDDDKIAVTLLEGSVKVVRQSSAMGRDPITIGSVILRPGQQATLTQGSLAASHASIAIGTPDMEQVMAWKNNLFVFNGSKLEAVMREIARWYDVNIHYEGPVTDEDFVGVVSRSENISQVLKLMEATQKVKFTTDGKVIKVASPH